MAEDTLVYLDWAATAPLCVEAAEAMQPYMVPGLDNLAVGANANSLHSSGRRAFAALEDARARIARSLGARRPDEIIFTSGATEANNAALFGMVAACKEQAVQQGKKGFVPHIITTLIEHDAVLACARMLQAQGCEVTYLRPTRQGFVTPEALTEALQDNTAVVSVQLANNEMGAVQPIAELAALAHARGALFHTDAVQALGKIPVSVEALGVDALSLSAHKVGGPKGVGLLCLRARTPFVPFLVGGGQEFGKRSGTQNVCGAAGFAAAVQAACSTQEAEATRLRGLQEYLCSQLAQMGGVLLTVDPRAQAGAYLPHIVNVCVSGKESETMILRFDRQGIQLSGGSACSSQSLEPSHVLSALGIQRSQAQGSLRISMGRDTTEQDIDFFLDAFKAGFSWKAGT